MMIKTRGFTLIELLVVIAIIGVLASVVLASLNTARAKGRDAKRASDLRSLQTALELYYSTNNAYPNTSTAWRSQCAAWGTYAASAVIPGLSPTYISQMPADPAMVVAANQNCYLYISNGTDYKLLNYNIIDSPNPGSMPGLVDPNRNYGQPYPRPAGCPVPPSTESTKAFALYTPGFMCY